MASPHLPLLVALLAPACAEDPPSSLREPERIEIAGGVYYALEPAGWDGGALPAMVFLHGHGGNGYSQSMKTDMQAGLDAEQVLGIFPSGEHGNWKVGHHEDEITRDDVAFIEAVAADAAERWPVSTTWLGGSSEGAAMVYAVLCAGPGVFSAYLPASGSFFDPDEVVCEPALAPIRHLHGRADEVWPLEGEEKSFGVQGGAEQGLAMVREAWTCEAGPIEDGACMSWDCGVDMRLCLHDGKHGVPDGWLLQAAPWARSVSLP